MKIYAKLLPILIFLISCEIEKKDKAEINSLNSITKSSSALNIDEIETIEFSYNKMEIIALRGKDVVNKEVKISSGKISFSKSEVRFYQNNSFERYKISEVNKHSDGTELRTKNNKDERCVVSIITRNNDDLVSAHFIDMEMIILFYINQGFSISLNIYYCHPTFFIFRKKPVFLLKLRGFIHISQKTPLQHIKDSQLYYF